MLYATSRMEVLCMKNVKNSIMSMGVTLSLLGVFPWGGLMDIHFSSSLLEEEPPGTQERLFVIQGNALLSSSMTITGVPATRKIAVMATAYSSTVEQTDDTPFITASGTTVQEGTVAANFLPFGTKIMLPELYGNKVFTVEDRMHPRKDYQVDIWFPDTEDALHFGAKTTYIEVL